MQRTKRGVRNTTAVPRYLQILAKGPEEGAYPRRLGGCKPGQPGVVEAPRA